MPNTFAETVADVDPAPVRFDHVTFKYRRRPYRPVLRDFSWTVPLSRTLLLGPNGAGKSTMLQLAAGLLRQESGTVEGPPAQHIGYMPQTIKAVAGLSVLDQVAYCAWLRGEARGAARDQARDVLQVVDLADKLDQPGTSLSGGQLRRMGVAQALVGQSQILLMDEPTAGLDPEQRDTFAELIGRIEIPMLIASHQIEDIDRTFDEVALLLDGSIVFHDTVTAFLTLDPTERGDAQQAYKTVVRGTTTTGARA